ncbi:polyprenol reductase isoform X2 [Lingula anatina]|uniref:Polyprenal reductase n=1 Tax=Lingula anatina TaxID=7574 RepID=A0A1S3HMB8_LINAN|nr:polyprenol reductase isoform X2 [Lingula anatina]|eukprot:XP_013387230.1 polyprenol reductase isoform X2 [Lingula anatina]
MYLPFKEKGPVVYYILSLSWLSWLGINVFGAYMLDWNVPYTQVILQYVAQPHHNSTDALSTMIGLSMLICQHVRRLDECLHLNIYTSVHMNVLPHMMQYLLPVFLGLSLVAEGPPLERQGLLHLICCINWYHPVGIMVFILASKHQHICYSILTSLRKDKSGQIVSTGYKVPRGDWFGWISCPHLFADILIYTAIGICLGLRQRAWCLCTLHLLVHHIFYALHIHRRYGVVFKKEYPTDRAALIPFLL